MKEKILFFASNDFALESFSYLIDNGYNVVGLITTLGEESRCLTDMAKDFNIPYYVLKNNTNMVEDLFLMDFIERLNADLFCVMPFNEIIPNEIISKAKKCCFGVCPSLLPCLPNKNTIREDIRNDYKKTGVTSYVLTDNVFVGDILSNALCDIKEDDTYTSLMKSLSHVACDVIEHTINEVLSNPNWKRNTIKVYCHKPPVSNILIECEKEVLNYIRSVDDTGLEAKIFIFKKNKIKRVKEINCKIFKVHGEKPDTETDEDLEYCLTDGKTCFGFAVSDEFYIWIDEISVDDGPKMYISEFLENYHSYFDDDNFKFKLVSSIYE